VVQALAPEHSLHNFGRESGHAQQARRARAMATQPLAAAAANGRTVARDSPGRFGVLAWAPRDIGGTVVAMSFAPVPVTAAWHHRGARSGFEVVVFGARGDGCRIEGWTTAIDDGAVWVVEYVIEVDAAWATRSAAIHGRSAAGSRSILAEADGRGHWLVDGKPARRLDGCLDVDLEASAMTNALPVRRIGLPVAAAAAAPAAYVRAADLAVERLEQTYVRTTDEAACQRYEYTAPAFGFAARLVYDESGLVLDYPGIAVRAG
jgi:uncharacterized protein